MTEWLSNWPNWLSNWLTDYLSYWLNNWSVDKQIITCRSISEYSLPESSFEGATLFLLKNFRDLLALTGDPGPLSPASTDADLSGVLS